MCAGELETVVRLKLPISFVVISNATYGWIKAGQKAGYAERYFSVDFGVTDHAKVARLSDQELESDSSVRARCGAEKCAIFSGADAGRHRLPAVARSEGAGLGVGRMIERGHHDMAGCRRQGQADRARLCRMERRADALAVLMGGKGVTVDERRRHIEALPPRPTTS